MYHYHRSRLARLEQRRNWRKAVLMAAAAVTMVIAAWWLGLPILSAMAGFWADVRSAGQAAEKGDLIPPSPPRLVSGYEATNSAQQKVVGWTEKGAAIVLTQNLQLAGRVVAGEDGRFIFENVTLGEGRNEFVAVAMDSAGNKSQPSEALVLEYWNRPPVLEVEAPADRLSLHGRATVEVKGRTEPGARVAVNDRVIVVSGQGRFTTDYGLHSGENALAIVAVDRAGNVSRKELVVYYEP